MIKNTDRTSMKEIKAIIQPAMLSRVIGALKAMTDLPGKALSPRDRIRRTASTASTQ